ncbi:conserved hypothetical protein [Denitrovibrio acetiphilus DSM 12809]|uniref:Type I restriction modification DNA specificity domain-containing protein n=1 Tax=Denitrovibrio acetiphilus (strain DSM 12809 / NBRC 114555 / N2460) TaxID=522772 RepID=D4H567_DENA2|nr:restriction endonuclease subunit S [Denitrovibrio acetiphilus]ADD69423.1 conserved hypothetical protein [Denitrovibrio acetiphilus DSM 12809]
MKSNYKKIGNYIQLVDKRNNDLKVNTLLGLTVDKIFIPSVANIVGSDMSKYKIIKKGQFACSLMQVRRDGKIPVALLTDFDEAIISQAYPVFKIIDDCELLPEYLMMWMSRSEFDREACFYAVGGVRGSLEWEDFCNIELPVPNPDKQQQIVDEYNTIVNRIKLNEQLSQKLEETAQTLYKHWFVDFEFPITAEYAQSIGKPELEGKPYRSSGGKMVWNNDLDQDVPDEWKYDTLSNRCTKIGSGSTPCGGKSAYKKSGISLIRSLNVHDYNFQYRDLAFIDSTQATKLDNVEVKEKDVLLNITGVSVARCCRVPSNVLPARVNQHVSIVRVEPEKLSSSYLLFTLCSAIYKQKLLGSSEAGSTRQAITKGDIEEFEILIPKNDSMKSFEEITDSLICYKENLSAQSEYLLKARILLLQKMIKAEATKC